MRCIVGTIVALIGLAVSGSSHGGSVTITQTNRSDEITTVFQNGGDCDGFSTGDASGSFGIFNESNGTRGSGPFASHNSSLTAEGFFGGVLKTQYVGAPDCGLGNKGVATGCVKFTVTGKAAVHIFAIMDTTLVTLGVSSALIEIRKDPTSTCDGGTTVYSRSVATNAVQDLGIDESILLDAGNYRLKVSCRSEDGLVGFFHSSKAQVDFNISIGLLENDDCANATFLIPNAPFAFDTTNATTDGPADAMCMNGGDDQIAKDIWYRVSAPCGGFMTVSTCGTADFDTRIAIYDGCPNARNPDQGGTLLTCDDDTIFCENGTAASTIVADSSQDYWVRVGGYQGQSGTGTILVTCGNLYDTCSEPLSIDEETLHFTTENASSSGPDLPAPCITAGNDEINKDIWLAHTCECEGRLQVFTCNDADFDTRLALYNFCPVSPDSPILACNDDTNGCGGFTSFVATDVVDGELIFIRLGGFQANEGEGNLTVRCLVNPADLNDDGHVDGADLGLLLGAWDLAGMADINMDGVVNGADLGLLLSAWTG